MVSTVIIFLFRSSKEAYIILERLQKFSLRPVFKEQLKTKYEAVLRQYENELTTIETWFLVRVYYTSEFTRFIYFVSIAINLL